MTAKLVTQRIRIIESQAAKDSGKISAKVSVNGSIAGDEEGSTNGTFEDLKAKTKRTAPAATSKAAAKRNGIAESIILTTKEKPKEQNFYTMIPDVDDDDQLIDAFLMRTYHLSFFMIVRRSDEFPRTEGVPEAHCP